MQKLFKNRKTSLIVGMFLGLSLLLLIAASGPITPVNLSYVDGTNIDGTTAGGVLPVAVLSGSMGVGNQSTNTIGVQSSQLTNIVLLLNNISNQVTSLQNSNNLISARVDAVTTQIAGGIGFTNATAPLTNASTDDLYVQGWPLYSVAAQFAVGAINATNTNNAAIGPIQTVIADSQTNTPFLLSCTYVLNTNVSAFPAINARIIAYVFKDATPTALGANGAITFTYADFTNLVGTIPFTNIWTGCGTNATQTAPCNFNVSGTNYVVVAQANSSGMWTNVDGEPKDTMIFSFQRGQ